MRSAHFYCLQAMLLVLCAGLSAQSPGSSSVQQVPSGSVPANAGALPGDLVISPDDVLDIYVMDVPELSRQHRVSPAGTILFPLLEGPLQAAGMRLTEFSGALSRKLRETGVVSNANVVASIATSRLKSVAITGAVKMPQIYPVFGATTLLDVLSQAQGLTDDAGSVAIINRGGNDAAKAAEPALTVDLKKLLETGDSASNVEIFPGDRITVPRAGIVYVVGAVNKPGGFTIKSAGDGMTVLQAVALAEGLKSTAIRSKVAVIRAAPNAPGGREQLPLNLKSILAGKAEDPVLQASDILFIPDSEGAKAFRRGIEAVLQTATGVVIYRR